MSMQDPVANMLTVMRNAQMMGKPTVVVPCSRQKTALAGLLKDEGYILGYSIQGDEKKPILSIELKYFEGRPVINKIKRISCPGLRIYKKSRGLPKILGGLGIAVVSTSQGLMTDQKAREKRVGGEIICYVE